MKAMTAEQIIWPGAVKLIILTVFLSAIFFIRRPWCRILCPLGAIFSLPLDKKSDQRDEQKRQMVVFEESGNQKSTRNAPG